MNSFSVPGLLLLVLPFMTQGQMPGDNLTAFNSDGPANPFLNNAPKEWVKEQDRISGRIPKSKLLKMQNAAEAMVAFLHDSCFSEIDFAPVWHGEYSLNKFGIQCRSEDGKGQLTIMSNDLTPLLRYLTVNGKEYAGIRPSAGVQNDYHAIEYIDENNARIIAWLVTADPARLPYTEITRKEYLQEARGEVAAIKSAVIADIRSKTPIRPAAIQEADKKASLEGLNHNYSGADLEVRLRLFSKNYQTDEEYLQASSNQATAGLDKTLRLMDSLLNRSTLADLNKPAMVSVEAAAFRGFEDNEADRNMLIRVNPNYNAGNTNYNAANPGGEKPQFFLVSWSYDPTGATISNIDRSIRENIDFRQLREMLDR